MINSNENKPNRAGRYVRPPAGYRTFIPAPLPPDRPLDLRGPLREKLSEDDYALGRLDGAVLTLPNADLFVFMYVRKEAVLSSQIEGTQSSLQNPLAARPAHPQRGHGARVAGANPRRGQPDRRKARGDWTAARDHRLCAEPAFSLRSVFAVVRGGRGMRKSAEKKSGGATWRTVRGKT